MAEPRRHTLVIVGDAATTIPSHPFVFTWLNGNESYRILPVFPKGAALSALAPQVKHLNAVFWTKSLAECVDDVLGVAGVTSEDRRVFVSYRRPDSLEVAEQLFEALEKARFDVFVDRFRVPPAVDVQERLTDDLAHKSMVLVLESPTLLQSRWIEHELNFAKKHDLGRLAIHLPGAVPVPWLDEDLRLRLTDKQLDPPAASVTPKSRLTDDACEAVVQRLITEHTRALNRRQDALTESIRTALTLEGVKDHWIATAGCVRARVSTKNGPREYAIWTNPRPPDVADFQTAHSICAPGPDPRGALVTTTVFQAAQRRRQADWLAERSLVHLIDAGRIAALAAEIKAGNDLA